jgi:hypothetical protein
MGPGSELVQNDSSIEIDHPPTELEEGSAASGVTFMLPLTTEFHVYMSTRQ